MRRVLKVLPGVLAALLVACGEKAPSEAESESEGLLESCAKALGTDVKRLKLSGIQNVIVTETDVTVAAKLTGNKSKLTLRVLPTAEQRDRGASAPAHPGVCLFLAGNRSSAEVTIETRTAVVTYIGRGNQPRVHLEVASGASVERIETDLKGNGPTLVVDGDGSYSCPTGSGITCAEP